MIDADLTFRLVDTPISKWCSSGHKAAETFKKTESGGLEEPTRFFQISGKEIEGCYCEPCIIVASWIAKQNKKGK